MKTIKENPLWALVGVLILLGAIALLGGFGRGSAAPVTTPTPWILTMTPVPATLAPVIVTATPDANATRDAKYDALIATLTAPTATMVPSLVPTLDVFATLTASAPTATLPATATPINIFGILTAVAPTATNEGLALTRAMATEQAAQKADLAAIAAAQTALETKMTSKLDVMESAASAARQLMGQRFDALDGRLDKLESDLATAKSQVRSGDEVSVALHVDSITLQFGSAFPGVLDKDAAQPFVGWQVKEVYPPARSTGWQGIRQSWKECDTSGSCHIVYCMKPGYPTRPGSLPAPVVGQRGVRQGQVILHGTRHQPGRICDNCRISATEAPTKEPNTPKPATVTATPTGTVATPTPTNTPLTLATSTPVNTTVPTDTPTSTSTSTATATSTGTVTPPPPTNTATSTATATATATATSTASATSTMVPSQTPTLTSTATSTSTSTSTPSPTATNTATATSTNTPTNTATNTATATSTSTPTNTETPVPASPTPTTYSSPTPTAPVTPPPPICDHVAEKLRIARTVLGPEPWTEVQALGNAYGLLRLAGYSGSFVLRTDPADHPSYVYWEDLVDPMTGRIVHTPTGIVELNAFSITTSRWGVITDDWWDPASPVNRWIVLGGTCFQDLKNPGVQGDASRTGSQVCRDVVGFRSNQITAFFVGCEWDELWPTIAPYPGPVSQAPTSIPWMPLGGLGGSSLVGAALRNRRRLFELARSLKA